MPGLCLQSGQELLDEFEELTKNVGDVQEATLRSILEHNSNADYLLRHGLNGRTDASSFRSLLPVITYADIEADIERVASGDKSPILAAKPIQLFFISSGTSRGRPKHIPCDESFFYTTIRLFRIGLANRSRTFLPIKPDRKVMDIVFCGKQVTTRGGIRAGTGTTNYFVSEAFQMKQAFTKTYNSSPQCVIYCPSIPEAMYCHLLFGLANAKDIQIISSTFVYTILEALKLLESSWESLAWDLEHGTLAAWITDPGIRSYTSANFKPAPAMSKLVRSECRKGFKGIVPRLWPNAKYVLAIMTGSMEPYHAKMRHYAGRTPLVPGDYGASESWVAINLNPLASPQETSFTIVPDLAYFEFIPLHRRNHGLSGNEQLLNSSSFFLEEAPVKLVDVKIGAEYEIVVTTACGLYRYRLGDVVQITGFYNSAPQFRYVCRKDVFLSINIDKNGERDLEQAMLAAAPFLEPLHLEVADYTSCANVSGSPGHYVLFLELVDGSSEDSVGEKICSSSQMQAYCDALDRSFVEPGYRVSRTAGTIGPLQLCIVEAGAFAKLAQNIVVQNKGTMSQYKTPRCLVLRSLVQLMMQNVKASFRSV